jgi:hypothetical protein
MIVNGTGVKETTEARAHLVTGVQKLTLPDRYGPDFIRTVFLLPLFHRLTTIPYSASHALWI